MHLTYPQDSGFFECCKYIYSVDDLSVVLPILKHAFALKSRRAAAITAVNQRRKYCRNNPNTGGWRPTSQQLVDDVVAYVHEEHGGRWDDLGGEPPRLVNDFDVKVRKLMRALKIRMKENGLRVARGESVKTWKPRAPREHVVEACRRLRLDVTKLPIVLREPKGVPESPEVKQD